MYSKGFTGVLSQKHLTRNIDVAKLHHEGGILHAEIELLPVNYSGEWKEMGMYMYISLEEGTYIATVMH